MDDELVAQFVAITSAEPALAEQYLSVSDNNLESAVSLFFESGGASIESQVEATERAQSHGVGAGPGGVMDTSRDAELAAEMAARSQPQEEVRERIQPITERLINPEEEYAMGRVHQRGAIGIFNQRAPPGYSQAVGGHHDNILIDDDDDDDEDDEDGEGEVSNGRRGVGAGAGPADEDDDDDDDLTLLRQTVGNPHLTPHQSRLASLFRPPFDLIKNVPLERAKDIAKIQKRWVMANIQDNGEFACQQLNRDLWSDAAVKEVVKENFVFVQYASDSPAGEMYRNFYPFTEYPHISILDPRTGEQLKVWSKVPQNEQFIEEVHGFLASFSLEPGHRNPLADIPTQKRDPTHMTEDEQIEYVVRQSLNQSQSQSQAQKSDDVEMLDEEEDDDDILEFDPRHLPAKDRKPEPAPQPRQPQPQPQEPEEPEELTEQDVFATILPEDVPEPEGPDTTRIQIRLGNGKRLVRRVKLSDRVRLLYSIVKHQFPEVQGEYFSLTGDRKNLFSVLDQTIEEANLKNSSIMVEIHED